jgi:DNA-binding MarR family transcriptional regulator
MILTSDTLSHLVTEVLRLAGALTQHGDRLVADLGLSSARWSVLGMIDRAAAPQPVAWVARDMRVSRQSVQRLVNDMARDGLVALQNNPHHLRAPLVVLTVRGKHALAAAMQRQNRLIANMAATLPDAAVTQAVHTLAALRDQLEHHAPPLYGEPHALEKHDHTLR